MPKPCEGKHPVGPLPPHGTPHVEGGCRYCWLYVHDERYRVKWGGKEDEYPLIERRQRPRLPDGGPGTELKVLLASMGFTPGGCQCETRIAQMNRWGVEECETNREEILGWLREESRKRGWGEKIAAGLNALKIGFLINPLSPEESLLDEALRRTRLLKEKS